jgi:hypothetical protein
MQLEVLLQKGLFNFYRRIEAEERALAAATVVFTSTKQEVGKPRVHTCEDKLSHSCYTQILQGFTDSHCSDVLDILAHCR